MNPSPHSPVARRRGAVLAVVLTAAALAGCGVKGGDQVGPVEPGSTLSTIEASSDPDEALRQAVEATLSARSFDIATDARLEIGTQTVHLEANGPVDYDNVVADVQIKVDQSGSTRTVEIRADGTRLWYKGTGPGGPAVPDDKTWVQGKASLLGDAKTFQPTGLMGVVLSLLGSTDAKQTGTAKVDGVDVRTYSTTVSYKAAVRAAGDRSKEFKTSLSLTSPKDLNLDVSAAVGPDGIIRRFDLKIDNPPSVPLGGTYSVKLTKVGQPVAKPDAPPANDTLTGPRAERFLRQLVN